jgi:hypothetical protein
MILRRLSQILAVLLLGSLAENWRLVAVVLYPRDATAFVLGGVWLGLVVGSGVGLLKQQRWGAYLLLLLAPYGTVMLATPLVPGVGLLGLASSRVLALNLAVFVGGALLAHAMPPSRPAEA